MNEHSNHTFSLIQLEGEKLTDSCRYCDDTTLPKAQWYISSSRLDVDDYRILMNSGWRRHGTHVYKTMNKRTCCPAFPIRCDAEHFKVSKAQRRVLNVVANFLMKDEKPNGAKQEEDVCGRESPIDKSDTVISPSSSRDESHGHTSDTVGSCQPAERIESTKLSLNASGGEVDACGRSKSSKQRRWQAQQERMAQRAEKTGVPYEEIMQNYLHNRKCRSEKNKPKELEDYFQEETPRETAAHTLEMRLCMSAEVKETFDEEYKLYYNHQIGVHGASPTSITPEAFAEFLVETALVSTHDAAAEVAGAPQFGSYHLQYWLDGQKLIAVNVVDLVPGCLSYVYFFYDPQYAFLNLGTYAALRGIAFIRHLHRTYGSVVPAYADFTQCYLGYYIHSCSKMRYKAQFSPSYLACPETHVWVPMAQCKRLLDQCKYDRLAEEESAKSTPTKHSDKSKTVLQLPFSEAVASVLPRGGFAVEGDAIVTTLAEAEAVVSEGDRQLVHEWTSLVINTGTMRICCTI